MSSGREEPRGPGRAAKGALGLLLLAAGGSALRLVAPEPVSTRPFAPPGSVARPVVARGPAPDLTRVAPSAAPPAVPAVAASPAASLVQGSARCTAQDAAAQLTTHLVGADRGADVMALGAAIRGDPEMAPLIAAEARRLAEGGEAPLRARGVLILAALGALDVHGWREAVAREGDASARERMVDVPPLAGHADEDREVARALLDIVARDRAAPVRVAALRALPRRLDADQVAAVARSLREDLDPSVRTMSALWLRGANVTDPGAVRALVAAAAAPAEVREVRRAAASTLLRLEERAPGTLQPAGTSAEALHRLLDLTSDDAG